MLVDNAASYADPWNRVIGIQSRVLGFGSLFGIRIGQIYGIGAGGKYWENRVEGLYELYAWLFVSTTRCCVVSDAGVVPTGTYGIGAAGATGTSTRRVVVTPDPALPTVLVCGGTSTIQVGPICVVTHASVGCLRIIRSDSVIAEPVAIVGGQYGILVFCHCVAPHGLRYILTVLRV